MYATETIVFPPNSSLYFERYATVPMVIFRAWPTCGHTQKNNWKKLMMKTLDMLSKHHPDKHKSGLHQLKSHRTPKESQDIQGLGEVLAWRLADIIKKDNVLVGRKSTK